MCGQNCTYFVMHVFWGRGSSACLTLSPFWLRESVWLLSTAPLQNEGDRPRREMSRNLSSGKFKDIYETCRTKGLLFGEQKSTSTMAGKVCFSEGMLDVCDDGLGNCWITVPQFSTFCNHNFLFRSVSTASPQSAGPRSGNVSPLHGNQSKIISISHFWSFFKMKKNLGKVASAAVKTWLWQPVWERLWDVFG